MCLSYIVSFHLHHKAMKGDEKRYQVHVVDRNIPPPQLPTGREDLPALFGLLFVACSMEILTAKPEEVRHWAEGSICKVFVLYA